MYDFCSAAARYTRFPSSPIRTVAFDFETTGLNLKHGDAPFMLSATFSDGEQWLWEAEIDYLTRTPKWTPSDAAEILEFFSHPDWIYIGSNAKYDGRCARLVCPTLDVEDLLCRCHETIGMHFTLANQESHALKDAGAKHGGITNTDETDLKADVDVARKEAASLGWKIASKATCPQVTKAPDKGWGVMDYGLPRQLALYYWRTSEAGLYLENLPKKPRYLPGLSEDEKVSALFSPPSPSTCIYVTPTWSELSATHKREIVSLPGWKWHPPSLEHPEGIVLGRGPVHPWYTRCAHYCKLDTLRSVTLYEVFRKQLLKEGLWEVYMEGRLNSVMSFIIEEAGVPFKVTEAKQLREKFAEDAIYTKACAGYALSPTMPINPNSSQQIAATLYGERGFNLPITRLSKGKNGVPGGPTTDQDYLSSLIGQLSHCSETFSPQKISAIYPPTYLPGDPTFRRRMQAWHKELVSDKDEGRAKQLYMFCASLLQYNKNIKGMEQIDNFLLRKLHEDPETGFATLFSSINPYGTHTGRQSHSNPNGGNISKGGKSKDSVAHLFKDKKTLRCLFGPPAGYDWWSCDYVQFQLIIFAIMSKTDGLISAYLRGDDLHAYTARAMYGHCMDPSSPDWHLFDPVNNPIHKMQRDIAKAVNFAFLFGAGAAKINLTAGVDGMYDVLADRLPTAVGFLEQQAWEARNSGFVRTLGGLKLALPNEKEYSGSVYAIQGTEAEIVKRATYGVQDYLDRRSLRRRRDFFTVLPVHDELDYLSRSGVGQRHIGSVCTIMADAAASLGVPARVDVKLCRNSWAEGEVWEEELL